MRKRSFVGALLCSMCLITGSAMPAMADSMKVVTLGADLSQAQKDTMMRYFKVDSSQVELLTITNQDERDHLSSYVPLEQIGTRTVSCAYVRPTNSGGIKVRTANLNWVTGNMIATTLSTSGVRNCEVVAACPFEVSGTGALTGIQMAYESASGEKLDETKKALATEEIVVTGNLAEQVGQNDATNVINQAKMQIIQNNIQDADEIYNIVVNIAEQNNVTVDTAQLDKIVALLEEIAQQNYNYDDVKETLEHVEENVTGEAEQGTDEEDLGLVGDGENGDSIVEGLDESVLGSDVIASSTEDPLLEQETSGETGDSGEIPPAEGDGTETIPPAESDGTETIPPAESDGTETIPPAESDGTETIPPAEGDGGTEAALNTDSLSEDAKALFDQAKTFCTGEFEGDAQALKTAMGEEAASTVVLEQETAKKLSAKVQEAYLKVLGDGTEAYVPADTDMYMTAELNMLDKGLKDLFAVEGTEADAAETDILAAVSPEDKQTLYNDTMKFFEKLYGESTEAYNETEGAADEGAEG